MITFVGIIGKNNKPLYLKAFGLSRYSEARLIEMAFLSCDIFQEKLDFGDKVDTYFGLLSAFDGIDIYGSQTNTKIKFIITLEQTRDMVPEAPIKSLLNKIQSEYVKAGKRLSPR